MNVYYSLINKIKNKMNPRTSKIISRNNNYNEFPKNREFYLLDSEDILKYVKKTHITDPDFIYVYYENSSKKIHVILIENKIF